MKHPYDGMTSEEAQIKHTPFKDGASHEIDKDSILSIKDRIR